jgi:hypothetical protein
VLKAGLETETAAEPAWSGSPWPRCSPQRRPGRPGEPPGSPAGWKPGTSSGLYRIEITGTGNDGKPLPARFNAKSTLGTAVGAGVPEYGMASVTLD